MKKIFLIVSILTNVVFLYAQFTVKVEIPQGYQAKDAYLYTVNGSKDILSSKAMAQGQFFTFKHSKNYMGLMKVYFPKTNHSLNLISENKDVSLAFRTKNKKIGQVVFHDEANQLMNKVQDRQKKLELIYPALLQIGEYYQPESDFGIALNKEIASLETQVPIEASKNPFVSFYHENYTKFLVTQAGKPRVSKDDIIGFLNKANELLESSLLMKPVLINYLKMTSANTINEDTDKLINTIGTDSPRGQTVLSELIDIFGMYGMEAQKEKYLAVAKNLKCTINDRLLNTININENIAIGAKMSDTKFTNPVNTKAKSIHEVKADKKIILFWSSTCTHCEKELPEIIAKYNQLKANHIEVIALSLDSDKDVYQDKIKNLPWINDSELKGWNSSYSELYNISATPTFFIVDHQNKIIAKPNSFADAIKFLKLK